MKKFLCLFTALLAAAALVRAENPVTSDENPAPAPTSRFSVGVHLSYWDAGGLDDLDLDGAYGGGVIGQFRLCKFLALELRVGGYAAGRSQDTYYRNEGWYENDTTVAVAPFEAGLVAFLPIGDKFSLYGGPGGGYYFFDGEIHNAQGPWESTYHMDFDNEAGFYALLGARAQLARNAALFLEGKYTWVETTLHHDGIALESPRDIGRPETDQDLDFSGLSIEAGMIFTF
jgi:hypothetical protein